MLPYPSNSNTYIYENSILNFLAICASFTGFVCSQAEPLLNDQQSRGFAINVTEYVYDNVYLSTLLYIAKFFM